ncbi:molybdenum ABC transporter ATP-binding protein ModC [Vibrio sonorensis]|uniref:molybdenum ABC transporter ATP-binding protein ModC n=1 Tax=Vibrio sonorensis TaxID=1004316 RepID=UPI0008DB02EA|nr:molybdenum ABC transporter ATP-binding protein ModC [Vibrio sonorensis]
MINILLNHEIESKSFEFDVSLPSTGITAIFGRSGAGKTTLINAVAGLLTPRVGKISVGDHLLFDSQNGFSVPTHKRNVGYVFQEARLFPHMTVKNNLLFGVDTIDNEHFNQVTSLLALSTLLTRYPAQLSGGEKQRVAIGRALLSKPQVLLMDEPLASLDLPRKREVLPFLEQLANDIQIPILYVTHSVNEILRLASNIVIVDGGRVVAQGSVEDVWSSQAMQPWQSFSDRSSLLKGKLVETHTEYGLSKVELTPTKHLWVQAISATIGEELRLQVKANDVSLSLIRPQGSSIRNILEAEILSISVQESGETRQSVAVKLSLDQSLVLTATVTKWACEELQLKEGMSVFAQIKGVSVSQKDIAINH